MTNAFKDFFVCVIFGDPLIVTFDFCFPIILSSKNTDKI